MSGTLRTGFVGIAVATIVALPGAAAQDTREAEYNRAFTLENEAHAYREALELYRRIAADSRAPSELRERATRRAESVSEELASTDFTTLMPAGPIVYAELGRPGAQLCALLDQLGLLGSRERLIEEGAGSFQVSRELVEGLLGIRGAALAITGVPTGSGPPPGVLLFHPGDDGVVRGLLETALSARGLPVEPIDGMPTWSVEDQALVTLTARMVVASQSRQEIAGVLGRMRGERQDSLANDPAMRESLALRRDDLLYVCLNAEPVRPMITGLLAMQAAQDPQVALLSSVLDVQSLATVVGRAGVDPDGLSLDLALRLEEGHHNLAFDFFRPAPVDRDSLKSVPEGAAGFLTFAFNERGPAIAPLHENADDEPVVTAMDLGREVFANMVGVTLFGLPPDGRGGAPVPDVAAVISANDPARSRALWNLALGLASLTSGGAGLQPGTAEIAGHEAEKYVVGGGVPIYLVTHESELVISPSQRAIADALSARDEGRSIADDPAFADALAGIDDGCTSATVLHLGRLASMAVPFVPEGERAEVLPYTELLARTVISARTRYSADELGYSLAVRGLPRVDGLVARALAEGRGRPVRVGVQGQPARPDAESLEARFDRLVEAGDVDAARSLGRAILEEQRGDPRALNNFAWALLTEERYGARFDDLALAASQASNEATEFRVWQYLDTLALARFRRGDVAAAIELEEKALALVGDGAERDELEAALARYRAAAGGVADSRDE